MNLDNHVIDLLRCPETGEKLSLKDKLLVSESGQESYPLLEGLPWLLPNPANSLIDWGVKLNHFQTVLSQEIQALQQELPLWQGKTKQRLQNLLEGKQHFLQQVSHIVGPIISTKVASKNVYDTLTDTAPTTQNLLSYEANLYRDWIWGEEENALSAKIIAETIQQDSVTNMLVLGAGAGRLAYDLHLSLTPDTTIATDINPLLLLCADRILFGEGLDITEFPMQPKSFNSTVMSHQIPPVKEPPAGFYLLFADATKPALKAGSFDCVLTPWLIDIQPFELTMFLQSINQYLPMGGSWINFGSLVFNQGRDAFCYSIDEVNQLAESAGFIIEEINEHEIPYLKSPYNAGWRMETVWCWRAIKTKDVTVQQRPQHLPEWLLDTRQKIPASDEIAQFVYSHQTYAELAGYINGQYSLEQIARKFARQNKMDEQEALSMLKNFYLKMVNLG